MATYGHGVPGYTAEQEDLLARFGARLRDFRSAAGLSQAELAHRADLHPTYVSGIERGRRNVSLINIHALARALAVQPHTLLGDDGGATGEDGR
jgi:transcriptional regulator with XRE-family HTH domain